MSIEEQDQILGRLVRETKELAREVAATEILAVRLATALQEAYSAAILCCSRSHIEGAGITEAIGKLEAASDRGALIDLLRTLAERREQLSTMRASLASLDN